MAITFATQAQSASAQDSGASDSQIRSLYFNPFDLIGNSRVSVNPFGIVSLRASTLSLGGSRLAPSSGGLVLSVSNNTGGRPDYRPGIRSPFRPPPRPPFGP
jgi:hypothetical protein